MEALEGGIGFAPMMRGLQPRALVYLANHPKMARDESADLPPSVLETEILPLN